MTALEKIIDKHLTHRNKGDLQCRAQLIASITDLMADYAAAEIKRLHDIGHIAYRSDPFNLIDQRIAGRALANVRGAEDE